MPKGTSKFIDVKIKKTGEILNLALQPYEIVLYVCINQNGRMVDQFGSQLSQEKFIEQLENDEDLEIIQPELVPPE